MTRPVQNRTDGARQVQVFKRRTAFEVLERRDLLAFGLTTTTNLYTVDTGAGLVFAVARTTASSAAVGDLTSTILNGTQLEAPFSATSRYSHYESGLSSSTSVTATVDPNGNWIMIACNDLSGVGVVQYYIAEKGVNDLFMATYAPGPNSPSPGEMRFIMYTNHSVLVNAPAPSNNTGSTGAIESSDVFGFANGQTSSKYYGEYTPQDATTYGLSGGGFGVFMNIGNRETSSGGPFYKDIDYQTTSAQSTELYNYMFSGHSQTEAFRPGLQGPYALQFTTSSTTPAAPDYSFIAGLNLMGYVQASGRGTLTGTASGVPSGLQPLVALSNSAAQYWATPNPTTGAYTISGIKPGTYTETLYQGQLEAGTQTVTITAGSTATANIADTLFMPAEVFLIGTWDGTPDGFLNSDLIGDMHPSDVRMNLWGTFTDSTDTTAMTNYIVGTSTADDWPMAEWKEATTDTSQPIDNINEITFTLTAAQVVNSTLRIGLTRDASGRPIINVNGGSFSSAPGLSNQPSSRGITTGNWRGNNVTYDYSISASSLHVGTNMIEIEVASGSSDTDPWLGPSIDYDAVDLVATSSLTNAPKATSVVLTPSNPVVTLGGQQVFSAIVKDQFGNPLPLALGAISWSTSSTTLGSISTSGIYVAGTTAGSGTVTASYFDATSNSTKSATTNVTVDGAPTVATAASASPNPVTGTNTLLSVLGADDGGEANLTYTWSTTGTPPASVNFSANGTNAAKNITATFSTAGTYNFQVNIVDASGLSTTSSVSVVVNQTLTSITVSPGTANLTDGQTQAFAAAGLDQFGHSLATQPSFTWSLDSGSVGMISAVGLYTAPLSPVGNATIRATSGAISGTASVVVAYAKGDINLDGHVNVADMMALMGALTDLSGYQTRNNLSNQDLLAIADIDGDGHVTNADLQAFLNFLRSGGGSTSSEQTATTTSDTTNSGTETSGAATNGVALAAAPPVAESAASDSIAPVSTNDSSAAAGLASQPSAPVAAETTTPPTRDMVETPPAIAVAPVPAPEADMSAPALADRVEIFTSAPSNSAWSDSQSLQWRNDSDAHPRAEDLPTHLSLAQTDGFFASFAPSDETNLGHAKHGHALSKDDGPLASASGQPLFDELNPAKPQAG